MRFHATATKHYHHPVVGELTLTLNRLDIAADPGMTLFTYAAEPGSRSELIFVASNGDEQTRFDRSTSLLVALEPAPLRADFGSGAAQR